MELDPEAWTPRFLLLCAAPHLTRAQAHQMRRFPKAAPRLPSLRREGSAETKHSKTEPKTNYSCTN